MDEVFTLVKRLHGNMSADHSDGIIRTPYLRAFYGDRLVNLFEDIKKLYDPENIMNPGKKVGGTFDRVRQYLDVGKR
jgi:FAD/FMN-containing dehydrogenase